MRQFLCWQLCHVPKEITSQGLRAHAPRAGTKELRQRARKHHRHNESCMDRGCIYLAIELHMHTDSLAMKPHVHKELNGINTRQEAYPETNNIMFSEMNADAMKWTLMQVLCSMQAQSPKVCAGRQNNANRCGIPPRHTCKAHCASATHCRKTLWQHWATMCGAHPMLSEISHTNMPPAASIDPYDTMRINMGFRGMHRRRATSIVIFALKAGLDPS